MNIKDTLESLGYRLIRSGDFYRAPAVYRGGDNPQSFSIHAVKGNWKDFANGRVGSWKDFLSLHFKDEKEINKHLEGESEIIQKIENNNPEQIKKYPIDCLKKLLPLYDFYINRGISVETLKEFRSGLATNGAFNKRIIFPIFNEQNEIIGFAGRMVVADSNYPKWLLKGKKQAWAYPLFLNRKYIEEIQEVILVESIGDALALWESNIKNILVLFGLSLGKELLKQLIALNPRHIVISTNNDENGRGAEGAGKIREKLLKYFDNVEILLPPRNDFGCMSKEEIITFFKTYPTAERINSCPT